MQSAVKWRPSQRLAAHPDWLQGVGPAITPQGPGQIGWSLFPLGCIGGGDLHIEAGVLNWLS
jgi:hypothetical protein